MTLDTKFVQFAEEWHGGSDSMLYAVASTGGLSHGTIRPLSVEFEGEHASDTEWSMMLWDDLACELRRLRRNLAAKHYRGVSMADRQTLIEFSRFAEQTLAQLRLDFDDEIKERRE